LQSRATIIPHAHVDRAWRGGRAESEVLERGEGRIVFYERSDMPWPIADRDMVIGARVVIDSVTREYGAIVEAGVIYAHRRDLRALTPR
jgi:hypothetical protein